MRRESSESFSRDANASNDIETLIKVRTKAARAAFEAVVTIKVAIAATVLDAPKAVNDKLRSQFILHYILL